MVSTLSETAAPHQQAGRTPINPVRQLLRLTRTELTLFYRYRMALYIAIFPLLFAFIGVMMEGTDVLPDVDTAVHYIAGTLALVAMIVGILHVSNVYAARREQLVLKRFRASGVTPFALFGASTLAVLAVVGLLTVVIGALLAGRYGVWPADPVLVVLPLVLLTVMMGLVGAAFTRFTRNAESAQLMAMLPFMSLYAASGLMVPLESMPDRVADALRLLPMAPAVELVQSGYLGYDLTGGLDEASAATGLELWVAAAPSLGLLLVWLAVSVYTLRYFRWDPRQVS
ncbi:ABC-2 type transport system permease protein [Lipingzhangella halophila]|uniref:ABC-2 type transport system permease protein n=1 Tax=Lipingzhangella halophila TaxID=1783352 RepID=A0A7W7W0P7_9ACTN|nr:ABC transporter permease [Lipingzhangella halophila]MBB4929443.1 ABC-2 type transport system permease protein [Lipingzhangella halophila]